MKPLFAPWRIEYILAEKPSGCFFCDAATAEEADWKSLLLLHRTDTAMVIMNRYPYNGGHLLIAPLRHTRDYDALSDSELYDIMSLSRLCVRILKDAMQPGGFNLGMNLDRCAGAGVDDHLHMHVVPRWEGDTNFLPVLDHTRSIPVALDELWEDLRARFRDMVGQ